MKAANIDRLDHYSILGLTYSTEGKSISAQDIKQAYHRALLLHHPDKSNPRPSSNNTPTTKVPIDSILVAYQTLSNPTTRAEYDRQLRLLPLNSLSKPSHHQATENFRSGLEVADLDDLGYDERSNVWFRSCRCGEQRGFVVTEQDLEAEAKHGEVVTGCRGCSLWLNVQFQISDDDDEEHGNT